MKYVGKKLGKELGKEKGFNTFEGMRSTGEHKDCLRYVLKRKNYFDAIQNVLIMMRAAPLTTKELLVLLDEVNRQLIDNEFRRKIK
jgi:hypothetical protein